MMLVFFRPNSLQSCRSLEHSLEHSLSRVLADSSSHPGVLSMQGGAGFAGGFSCGPPSEEGQQPLHTVALASVQQLSFPCISSRFHGADCAGSLCLPFADGGFLFRSQVDGGRFRSENTCHLSLCFHCRSVPKPAMLPNSDGPGDYTADASCGWSLSCSNTSLVPIVSFDSFDLRPATTGHHHADPTAGKS